MCVVALCIGGTAARAALPSRVDVRAHAIGLYYGASPVVAADGAVVAHVGGRIIHSDALRYDLQHNRVVASGHVIVAANNSELRAAAYALDLASGDATALSLDGLLPQATVYHGNDSLGTVAPPAGNVFDVADFTAEKPLVRGPHAVIVPNANVRFTPARVLTEIGGSVPSPTYLFTFATNPSFAQQSLPGSTFDQPYGLYGTQNALYALHFMYDSTSGAGVGIDAHLVDRSKSYLVASVLPMTSGGRLDLVAFEQMTPALSQQVIGSHQVGFNTLQYQLLHNEFASVSSLTLVQANGFQSADLRISSLSHLIPHLFSYKFGAGIGYDHQNGMLPLSSDGRTTLSGLFTTPSLHGPLATSFTSSLSLAQTLYNYPRETGTAVLTNFFSKQVARSIRLIGQIQFAQIYDRYRYNQSFFYPPQTIVLPDGSIYYGYAAFNGASTTRTYSIGGTYSPNPDFNLQLTVTHNHDFPQFDGFGNPPYSLGFDVRVRPRGGPSIEFGRAYIFNWGEKRWSPGYILSIAP